MGPPKLDLPTLVLANRNDPQHPFEYGQELAREIPGAQFAEITAKAISGQKHVEDVRREILQFIGEIDSHPGAIACTWSDDATALM
jgi:pimeloyl-ACP methyl ester carboxylesterase